MKRFKKGIEELNELLKAELGQPATSPYIPPYALPSSPSHSISNLSSSSHDQTQLSSSEADTILEHQQHVVRRVKKREDVGPGSSNDSGIGSQQSNPRASGNFNKMKHLLEKKMGIPITGEIDIDDDDEDNEETPCASPPPPIEQPAVVTKGPPPIPKRSSSTILSNDSPLLKGKDFTDSSVATGNH